MRANLLAPIGLLAPICLLVPICLLAAGPAAAQVADLPKLSLQDSWTYKEAHESHGAFRQSEVQATVLRVGSDNVLLSVKTLGADQPAAERLVNADWSIARSVNGQLTVINRPLAFPLTAGKTWTIDYTEDNPNREHKSEHIHLDYKVTGVEDVTVPAGQFHAIKIEAEGQWTAERAPAATSVTAARVDQQGTAVAARTDRIGPGKTAGRLYKAFWYAPEVKRIVKADEEFYDGSGLRYEKDGVELEAYKVAP